MQALSCKSCTTTSIVTFDRTMFENVDEVTRRRYQFCLKKTVPSELGREARRTTVPVTDCAVLKQPRGRVSASRASLPR